MGPRVIGFSGSPVPNSNTDRAVNALLKATGLETEFVKLSDIRVAPCRACKRCVEDNICKQEDDFPELAEKIKKADALVIDAYSPYGSVDAFTKSLMERFWSLRHVNNLLRDKLAVTIVSGIMPNAVYKGKKHMLDGLIKKRLSANKMSEMIAHELQMEKMNLLGQVQIRGNVPCLTCGHGDECVMSGVRGALGPGGKAGADKCVRVEDHEDVLDEIQSLGFLLKEKLA